MARIGQQTIAADCVEFMTSFEFERGLSFVPSNNRDKTPHALVGYLVPNAVEKLNSRY